MIMIDLTKRFQNWDFCLHPGGVAGRPVSRSAGQRASGRGNSASIVVGKRGVLAHPRSTEIYSGSKADLRGSRGRGGSRGHPTPLDQEGRGRGLGDPKRNG